MRENCFLSGVALGLLVSLSSPARAMPFFIDGVKYASPDQALRTHKSSMDRQIATITKRPYLGGSVLIYLPPEEVLTDRPFTTDMMVKNGEGYLFYAAFYKQDFSGVAMALTKMGVFDSIEVKQVEGYESYAYDYGYRYVLVSMGTGWQLKDIVTGQVRDGLGPRGLKNLASRVETAARFIQAEKSAAVARTSQAIVEQEKLSYKRGRGSLSLPGSGIDTRARILSRIGSICTSKNVGLRAGEEPPLGGVYRIDAESLENGRFTMEFECLY